MIFRRFCLRVSEFSTFTPGSDILQKDGENCEALDIQGSSV